MDAGLSTGAMSRRSGLSHKALRLYHDNGLLVPAQVDEHTGYRTYAPEQVAIGQAVSRLRRTGMPLATIAEVLNADGLAARERVLGWFAEQEHDLGRRRAGADGLASLVEDGIPGEAADVGVRQVPQTLVAAVPARVTPQTVAAVITTQMHRVRTHLETCGAMHTGEFWALYHDAVAPGVDAQVEICVPYTGSAHPVDDIVLRVEPGGTEVFVPVRAQDLRYPQILPAFAAAAAHAATIGGPVGVSREVYTPPWPEGPDDIAAYVVVRVRS